jgi:predicted porin
MEQWAGVASQKDGEGKSSKNAFQSDTEVHFTGKTTLDNGVEVGAHIELEGESSQDQIDEQYLFVNGSFGHFEMGENDGVADQMAITAPSVGPVGVNDGDLTNWVSANFLDTVPSGSFGASADNPKVSYMTPSFGGFRAGLSYTDSNTSKNNGKYPYGASNGQTTTEGLPVTSVGLSYDHDFGAVSLGVSAVGEHAGEGNWYGLGTNVGFGNFTFGGSWGHVEDDFGVNDRGTKRDESQDAYDIGVAYAMDAAKVSLTYGYGKDLKGVSGNKLNTVDLGMAYTLGAGVTWKSSVFWFDSSSDTDTTLDNDGYGAVTGLRLDF